MPQANAVDYDTTRTLARQNVWTLFNAASLLKTDLETWRTSLFALPVGGGGIPPRLLIWDQVMLKLIDELPTFTQGFTLDFFPSAVVGVLIQVSAAFQVDPDLGEGEAFEAVYVAAWNAVWGP